MKPYLVNQEKKWAGSATAQSVLAGAKLGVSGNTIGGQGLRVEQPSFLDTRTDTYLTAGDRNASMQGYTSKAGHSDAELARMQQFRQTSGGLNVSANLLDVGSSSHENLKEGRLVGRNLCSKPVTSHTK